MTCVEPYVGKLLSSGKLAHHGVPAAARNHLAKYVGKLLSSGKLAHHGAPVAARNRRMTALSQAQRLSERIVPI